MCNVYSYYLQEERERGERVIVVVCEQWENEKSTHKKRRLYNTT